MKGLYKKSFEDRSAQSPEWVQHTIGADQDNMTPPETAEQIERASKLYLERRKEHLGDFDFDTVKRAWFTLSHLLLQEGSEIVDMGCGDGTSTYIMAALAPDLKFTGIDKSKRLINKAKEKYKLDNLTYKVGNGAKKIMKDESVDAIIDSFVLHEIYSDCRYSEQSVTETLRQHMTALKKNGLIFIREYARPPPNEFVLLEMPDSEISGDEPATMSEPDLLIWYSEHARPRQDAGTGGFFLEELPERIPNTRLFRLPFKWAYEFIMRKDDRKKWDSLLSTEYTFFTMREFRKELSQAGARVEYAAPHWDEEIIEKKFAGRFRLFENDGKPLGIPPTSYLCVARKVGDKNALVIEERRPSRTENPTLKIVAMRDEQTGNLVEVINRDVFTSEVIPYRIDEDGRLKVYLHDGVPRGIANTAPRKGLNIDGKRWSGHMIEAIAIENAVLSEIEEFDVKTSVHLARDYLGLKPQTGALVEKGGQHYPAPDNVNECIQTYYVRVEKADKDPVPKKGTDVIENFKSKGRIREFDAQQILNGITVGMIPNSRLELQILALFQHTQIRSENWVIKDISIQRNEITKKGALRQFMREFEDHEKRFKEVKGTTGEYNIIHSTFVEEGQNNGSVTGLSSQEIDFFIHDEKTVNTAVVLPLMKDMKGNLHAGVQMKRLPVPERHEGNGATLSCPTFNIPAEVKSLHDIKVFLADNFGVLPQMIFKLGEPYYSHIGVTPQKIYPFAIAIPPGAPDDPETHFIPFYQMMLLQRLISKSPHFMTVLARGYQAMSDHMRFDLKRNAMKIAKEKLSRIQPEWSIPLVFEAPPGKRTVINKQPGSEFNMTQEIKKTLPQKAGEPSAQALPEKTAIQKDAPEEAKKAEPPKRIPVIEKNLSSEFAEIEEFFEELENAYDLDKPSPEKW